MQQSFTHLVSGSVFWRDLALRPCPAFIAKRRWRGSQRHLVNEWAEVGYWEETVVNSVIGTPWRLTDGQRIVDKPEVRVDAVPPPPNAIRGCEFKGIESPSRTLRPAVPRWRVHGWQLVMEGCMHSSCVLQVVPFISDASGVTGRVTGENTRETMAQQGWSKPQKQHNKEQNVSTVEAM